MNKKLLLLLAPVVLAAAAALLFLAKPRQPARPPSLPHAAQTPAPTPAPPPARTEQPPPAPAAPADPSAAASRPPEMEPWEYRIDEILGGTADESQTAILLLNLLPTLPEEGQIEAASHAANLLSDEDFRRAMPILTNPNTPEPVLSVLMTDLMNRPDGVKLPGWLDIARMPGHPLRDEAISAMEIYLDDNYGENWGLWATKIGEYLAREAANQ